MEVKGVEKKLDLKNVFVLRVILIKVFWNVLDQHWCIDYINPLIFIRILHLNHLQYCTILIWASISYGSVTVMV